MTNTSPQNLPKSLPPVDLTGLKICFPVLLCGDLVTSAEHLGVAYLTSALRQAGARVRIIEIAETGATEEQIRECLNWQPDIIGISLTTVVATAACRFGDRLVLHQAFKSFIVAGGPLATFKGADLLRNENWRFLDALIIGEGEIPLLRLCHAFKEGMDLSAVPNLCFWREGAVISTPLAPPVPDLSILPRPARDQWEKNSGGLPYLRLSTSRGCTSHCSFCNAPHARNRVGPAYRAWRGLSPQKVVDEIEFLYNTYGCNTFDFVDSTFEDPGGGAIGKERVSRMADLILDRNLKLYFNVCMQAHNWTEADLPLLQKLVRAGLEKVLVGIESGSDAGLARWQKKATVADNIRIIGLLKSVGIYVAFGFIAFHPWSEFKEIRENTAFLKIHMGHNLRRYTTRLELYPGAEALGLLEQEGLLKDTYHQSLNPFDYHFQNPQVAHLSSFVNLLYGQDYATNGVILHEPSVFAFETQDIILSNFSSRLRKRLGSDAIICELLDGFDQKLAHHRRQITAFNSEIMAEFTLAAEQDRLDFATAPHWALIIEKQFCRLLRNTSDLKLGVGMKIRRHSRHLYDISPHHDHRNLPHDSLSL